MMLTLWFLAFWVKLVAADNLLFPELDTHNCMGNPFELNFFEKRAKDPQCAAWYQKLKDAKDIDSCPSLEKEEICVEDKLYAFVAVREQRCQEGDFEKAEQLCIKMIECWDSKGDDTCKVKSDNPCTSSIDSMRMTICNMLLAALMDEDDALLALSPQERSDAADMDDIYDKAEANKQEPSSGDATSDKDSSSESDEDNKDNKNDNSDTDTDKDDSEDAGTDSGNTSGNADDDSADGDDDDDDDDVAPAPSKKVSVVTHAEEGPEAAIDSPVVAPSEAPTDFSAEPPAEPPVEGPMEGAYAPEPFYDYAPKFVFPDEVFDYDTIEYNEEEEEYEAEENAELEQEYGDGSDDDDKDFGVGFGSKDEEGSNEIDEVGEDNAFVKIENKVENGDEEEMVAGNDKPPVVERQIEMTGDETSDKTPSRLIPIIVIAALLVAGGGVLYAFIRARRARQYEKYTQNVEPAPYGGYTGGYDRSHDTEMATQPPAASDQRLSQILLSATEGQNGNGKNGSNGARV